MMLLWARLLLALLLLLAAGCASPPASQATPDTPLDAAAKATAVANPANRAATAATTPAAKATMATASAPTRAPSPASPWFAGPLGWLRSWFAASPAPDLARPPLARSGDDAPDAWLQQWSDRLPVTATLTKGSTSESFGMGNTASYRTYDVRVDLTNETAYRLVTGPNQYLVETARADVPTGTADLLVVAGGRFTRRPAEDFAAITERREAVAQAGSPLPSLSDEADVPGPRFLNEHRVSADRLSFRTRGPTISFSVSSAPLGALSDAPFGDAGPGDRLLVESDLQFGVMVAPGHLGAVYLISPELRFSDDEGGQATFRYLLRFDPPSPTGAGAGPPDDVAWTLTERRLLPRITETLAPMVADAEAPLWQRVFAAHWLGDVAGQDAAATLLPLVGARGQENDALRVAAIDAAAQARIAALGAPALAILNDRSEAFAVRTTAMRALGRLNDLAATAPLVAVAGGTEQDEAGQAIRALGVLGDRSAAPALLTVLETASKSTLHPATGEALARLADTASLERLGAQLRGLPTAGRPGAAATIPSAPSAAVRAIGGIDTAESVAVLAGAFGSGSGQLQVAICNALARSEHPDAVPLLKQALASGEKTVASAAASALGTRSSPERVAALRDALTSSNPETQAQAATALGKLQATEARDDLLGLLGNTAAPTAVREQAARALGQLPSPASEQALRQALADAEPRIRKGAVGGLRLLSLRSAVADVVPLLADQDAEVRLHAAQFVGWAGDRARASALLDAVLVEADTATLGGQVAALIALRYADLAKFDALVERLRGADRTARLGLQRLLNYLTGQSVALKANATPADLDAAVAAWTTAAQEKGQRR